MAPRPWEAMLEDDTLVQQTPRNLPLLAMDGGEPRHANTIIFMYCWGRPRCLVLRDILGIDIQSIRVNLEASIGDDGCYDLIISGLNAYVYKHLKFRRPDDIDHYLQTQIPQANAQHNCRTIILKLDEPNIQAKSTIKMRGFNGNDGTGFQLWGPDTDDEWLEDFVY